MLSCLAFVRHDKNDKIMLIANRNEHDIDYFLPPEWHNSKTLLGNEVQGNKVKVGGIDIAILYKNSEFGIAINSQLKREILPAEKTL